MNALKRTLLAAWLICVSQGANAATQQLNYGIVATDATILAEDQVAGLARSLLDAPAAMRELDARERAVLHLAARDQAASAAFRALKCGPGPDPAGAQSCFLGAYAIARHQSRAKGGNFDAALRRALASRIGALDDVGEERVFAWMRGRENQARRDLNALLARYAGADRIGIEDAASLVRAAAILAACHASSGVAEAFIAEERSRRYRTDEAILIRTPGGASLAATLVVPKRAMRPLPTAMWFTIYSDPARNLEIAATAAAHGYAGLVVNARGKLQSPDAIRPYEVEADDTAAAIDWASRQKWSDGRVGMYGGSYSGFAAWAATKRLPKALKTIVPYVAAIPGQGLPMENNVFLNANYGWAFYVTNNRTLDRDTYYDPGRWNALNDRWYQSGRPYREIDQVDGTPNPWLQRWLRHPSYDAYWQAMVPYGDEFARIDIPVLTITGYYDDGQISALRYLKQHYRYRPDAEHYLVIGPYDHFGAQQPFKEPVLRGYPIDPVAQFDTTELTFAWFDHVFRGAERPQLLKDRVNYQVMGANVWRHASSIEAMSETKWTFYLTDSVQGGRYRLAPAKPERDGSIRKEVDFADRSSTSAGYYPFPILDPHPDLSQGLVFETEPLDRAAEVSGAFSGMLRVRANKRDFDFMAALYERKADGSLFALSYYLGRASYVRDIAERELLTPGALSVLPFDRTRLTSRRVAAGSRLVLVVDILKNGFHQVNYGTGGDVSDESLADAATPLKLEFQTDSFVEVPVTVDPTGGSIQRVETLIHGSG